MIEIIKGNERLPRYTATLEKETKEEIVKGILIPCYKREEKVVETIKYYSEKFNNSNVIIVLGTQGYSNTFTDILNNIRNNTKGLVIYDLDYDEPQNIGKLRKQMMHSMFNISKELYKKVPDIVLMHDNDITIDVEDISMMQDVILKNKSVKVVSPDTRELIEHGLSMKTRKCFGVTMMRGKDLYAVYDNLTEVPANEDSELVYLLENKGLLIHKSQFKTEFHDMTNDTVFSNKLEKLEKGATMLLEKYGKDVVEIITRPSGKKITRFIYNPDTFPMKIRFNEKPTTDYYNSQNNMKVTMINYPQKDYKQRMYEMVKATWKDEPVEYLDYTEEEMNETFKNVLKFKVLPNSMEHLTFSFLVEGLTLVEITHLLRHRMFSSIHAQCSADRFLTHDSAFIPSSIENSKFADKYKELTDKTKELYQEMVDSKEVSILDARYILPRNHRYFYYFTGNLKDLIGFINQRKCTQIQPEMDNILAHMILELVSKIIPEVKELIDMNCNQNCYFVKSPEHENSRVYSPDKVHAPFLKDKYNKEDYIYPKTRKEMGVFFNPQDK